MLEAHGWNLGTEKEVRREEIIKYTSPDTLIEKKRNREVKAYLHCVFIWTSYELGYKKLRYSQWMKNYTWNFQIKTDSILSIYIWICYNKLCLSFRLESHNPKCRIQHTCNFIRKYLGDSQTLYIIADMDVCIMKKNYEFQKCFAPQ